MQRSQHAPVLKTSLSWAPSQCQAALQQTQPRHSAAAPKTTTSSSSHLRLPTAAPPCERGCMRVHVCVRVCVCLCVCVAASMFITLPVSEGVCVHGCVCLKHFHSQVALLSSILTIFNLTRPSVSCWVVVLTNCVLIQPPVVYLSARM